jgi:DNA invertase Pin-like site-specific DNA recombinase
MKPKANERQRVAIYCRVSKETQDLGMQENELKEFTSRRGWTIHRIYRDHGESGAKRSRPALDELLADCRLKRFDVLAVWRLDRLARSLRQLLDIVELCKSIGVQFLSLTDGIDTSTAAGTFVFHVFAALSEMERD